VFNRSEANCAALEDSVSAYLGNAKFRAEAFNAFNHTNFTNPSLSLESPQTFGESGNDEPMIDTVRAAMGVLGGRRRVIEVL